MGNKSENIYHDLTTTYRKLPAKNRAGMIRAARNLLKQQDKDAKMLAAASVPSIEECYKGPE